MDDFFIGGLLHVAVPARPHDPDVVMPLGEPDTSASGPMFVERVT